jgi:methionine synthase II (cobalamin-independent)
MVLFAEPYLQAYGSAFTAIGRAEVLASLHECFSAAEALVCLHCCGNTDWPLLLSSGCHVISFDAYTCDESFALYPEDVARFLERGGMIAWGVVPTSSDASTETVASLVDRLERAWQRLVAKGIDKETLAATAFITPACGLATLTVPLAERIYQLTSEVAAVLRDRYNTHAPTASPP